MCGPDEIIDTLMELLPRGGVERHEGRGGGAGGVLRRLYRSGDGASPGALGQVLGVSGPRVTAILRQLEDQGLIRRSTDPADRRSVAVTLTDRGRDAVERRERQRRAQLVRLVEKIGPADAEALIRILKAAEELRREDAAPLQS